MSVSIMPNDKIKTFKILKGTKTIIRHRFPNFVCDGRPLGPEIELYMHTIYTLEDFYELEWVKEIMSSPDFVKWYFDTPTHICAEYKTDSAWHAVLEKGKLVFPDEQTSN